MKSGFLSRNRHVLRTVVLGLALVAAMVSGVAVATLARAEAATVPAH